MWSGPEISGGADSGDDQQRVEQTLQVLRLVIVALFAGALSFAAVVLLLGLAGSFGEGDPSDTGALLGTLLVFGLGASIAYPLVRRYRLAPLRRAESPSLHQMVKAFTELTFVGAAMAEGCVLFALVIHMVTGSGVALFVAAIAAALLLRFFPTRERWRKFVVELGGSASPVAP